MPLVPSLELAAQAEGLKGDENEEIRRDGRPHSNPARMALLTAADLVCTWSFS